MNPCIKNWRTTLGGVGVILGALADVFYQVSSRQYDLQRLGADLTAIIGGVSLIFAKDAHENHEPPRST